MAEREGLAGWTVTRELGMKRPCTPQRMLWVVRKDGIVYGKRHRTQGKAERFVEKMKGLIMSNYVNGKLNVEQYENRADATTNLAAIVEAREVREIAGNSATDVLQLCAEVRRLQAMQDRLLSLMEHKRNRIAKDRKIAAEQGDSWLGINTHTLSANMLDQELQNLERVLNG